MSYAAVDEILTPATPASPCTALDDNGREGECDEATEERRRTSSSAARVVPLGVMLGIDPSLAPALALEIGKGIWREGGTGPWRAWGRE